MYTLLYVVCLSSTINFKNASVVYHCYCLVINVKLKKSFTLHSLGIRLVASIVASTLCRLLRLRAATLSVCTLAIKHHFNVDSPTVLTWCQSGSPGAIFSETAFASPNSSWTSCVCD